MKLQTSLALAAILAVFFVATASSSILRQRIFADDSCEGKCNRTGTDPNADCQCNTACIRFNDCCDDYFSLCLGQPAGSCAGRCNQGGVDPSAPCQCNKPCVEHGDCCPDYTEECGPSDGISDKELADLTEQLLNLDTVNNATGYITADLQGKTSSGSNQDKAPNPLFTVSASAYTRPTIEKLVTLHDNYNPDKSVRESYTAEEETEIDQFIDAIFNTPVMQAAQEFLISKNLPNGKASFRQLWFELYTRGNGVISSCGFEHVFVGEMDSGGVGGFHNWEYFAAEENQDLLNYLGYMDFIDMGEHGSIIEHTFTWRGESKPISSMFIGTSPELELSLYTVCFLGRPNSKCPISLAGNKVKIQTYTIGSNGQYVATSYPDLSD